MSILAFAALAAARSFAAGGAQVPLPPTASDLGEPRRAAVYALLPPASANGRTEPDQRIEDAFRCAEAAAATVVLTCVERSPRHPVVGPGVAALLVACRSRTIDVAIASNLAAMAADGVDVSELARSLDAISVELWDARSLERFRPCRATRAAGSGTGARTSATLRADRHRDR